MATRREQKTPAVTDALAALDRASTKKDFDNLARFGIAAPKAFGVSMANIQKLARTYGRSHEFAAALWDSGWYEARTLAAYVDEPARVTPAQMERWCRDFDNWGICDTVCFVLFDRTPHAWAKVHAWSGARQEFVKRGAFALLASLAGHDKQASDRQFLDTMPLIEAAAADDRNFVKKGVSWALRRIGTRNAALHAAALATARQLAASDIPSARWIGSDGVRDLLKRKPAARSKETARATMPRMTGDDFRRLALALHGASEGAHMKHPDFRAAGRIFASLDAGERRGMAKLTPAEQHEFVREYPGVFYPAAGAWGRQGCTMIDLAAADEAAVRGALSLAWDGVVTRKAPVKAKKQSAKKKRY